MNATVNDSGATEAPAHLLVGTELEGGWRILKRVSRANGTPEDGFLVTYLVEREGAQALLKALDYSSAMNADDPNQAILDLAKTFEFEKNLLELCGEKGLTRIVKILAQGVIRPTQANGFAVPYLILEIAERDISSQIDWDREFSVAWLLKVLHSTTVGIWQLHKHQVAHTNLTADNVQEFSRELYKIAELGRAQVKGVVSPFDKFRPTENPAYATPEYLYGHREADWVYNSQAVDAFALGNLIFFLFTRTHFSTWLHFYTADEHKWQNWGGTFQEVLPYLSLPFDTAVNHMYGRVADGDVRDALMETIRQLCHPDPRQRGHPKSIDSIGSSLSVERFISRFRHLELMAKANLLTQ